MLNKWRLKHFLRDKRLCTRANKILDTSRFRKAMFQAKVCAEENKKPLRWKYTEAGGYEVI